MPDATVTRSRTEGRHALNGFHRGFLAARVGEWLYLICLNWLVLVQYESATAVGLINACRLLPVALVSIPSGVLADRYNSRTLMTWIYGLTAVLTLLVAWVAHSHHSLYTLALVVFMRELVGGMEPPTRNVLINELCPNELPRALASNATILNIGRVMGPVLAGYMIAQCELWFVFLMASLGAALCSVHTYFLVDLPTVEPSTNKAKGDMKEALRYVAHHPRLKLLIGLMIAPMLLAFPYLSLLPMFGKELLSCGPEAVGTLVSLTAVGSLVSSASIVGNSGRVLKGSFQIATLLTFSLSLLAVVMAPSYQVAAVAAFVAGASSQAYRTVSRILAQMGVPKQMQGRVVSLILMDRALIPVGTFILGWWAEHFGILSSGLLMSLGSGIITLGFVLWSPSVWNMAPNTAEEELVLPGRVLVPGPT